jgi:hypothetical protein
MLVLRRCVARAYWEWEGVAQMAGISVAMILGIGVVIAVFIMFRFAHVLMTLAGIVGAICLIAGVVKLTEGTVSQETAGAILISVGVFTLLALGITLKALRPEVPKLGTQTPPTPDE